MISEIQVGEAVCHEGLAVFPLFTESNGGLGYQLADEAMAKGSIVVEEVSKAGSVPELTVENKGNTRVLFLEGEELVGAKQNRVLNTSVLIGAKSKTRIPVSCVEQGRWRHTSRGFRSSGSHSSSKLRRILARSVHQSLKAERGHRSDQSGVWREVERQQKSLRVASDTAAMFDTFQSCQDRMREFRDRLGYVAGASGVAVAVGGKLVALDLFDKPSTCQEAWSRLMTGFMLDALEAEEVPGQVDMPDVERFLSVFSSDEWEEVKSVGEGVEHRAEADVGDHAFRLSLDGVTVHACVVSGDG